MRERRVEKKGDDQIGVFMVGARATEVATGW
jgi:hypothetical protein